MGGGDASGSLDLLDFLDSTFAVAFNHSDVAQKASTQTDNATNNLNICQTKGETTISKSSSNNGAKKIPKKSKKLPSMKKRIIRVNSLV